VRRLDHAPGGGLAELDLDDYARGRTLQDIRGFETGVLGGRRVTSRFGAAVSHAIRRSEFDLYLLDARAPASSRTRR